MISAGASDATGSATGQGIPVMHGSAKVEADHVMPAWPTCQGSNTNATPDHILDSDSSSEGSEVLKDNDLCEFDDSSKLKVQVKGNLRNNVHFWRGIGSSPFILSVIEERYKLPFFAFPEPATFKNNRSALEHAEFVESVLEVLRQPGRVIRCAVLPNVVNPFLYLCRPTAKRG